MPPDTTNDIRMSISKLLDRNFFIPSYQRGYRWTKRQVTDLLDDIYKFKPQKNEWYCLQPLVVKVKDEENNEWEVIDGQQRLTTIFLINHYLNEMWPPKFKKSESIIKYQTRDDGHYDSYKFLIDMKVEDDKDVKINDDNIDFHYISSAYKVINDWVKEKEKNDDEADKKIDDFKTKFKYNTKIIWYETDAEDGRDIFSRINMGKIPLTNAELIKALFLNSSNFKIEDTSENSDDEVRIRFLKKLKEEQIRLKQLKIAAEWDMMETELNNDEFWLFINKGENNKETRIDYLFELIAEKPDGVEDNLYTFLKFSAKFDDGFKDNTREIGEIIEDEWKYIKRCFQTLKDWFEDRELYHKIGYLITLGEDVSKLIKQSQDESKLVFKRSINGKIRDKLAKIKINEMEYPDGNIKSILLMHNIQTMLDNKEEKWDIEHIHAVASKMPEEEQHQKDWLNQTKIFIDENKTELLEKINKYSKDDDFEKLFFEILDYFSEENENGEKKHKEINNLSNLVLLDRGTNRKYKNAVFPVKRMTIIEREKEGTFIPLCTKNVFLKFYSLKIEQTTLWGEEDRKYYLDDIKKILSDYLPKEIE